MKIVYIYIYYHLHLHNYIYIYTYILYISLNVAIDVFETISFSGTFNHHHLHFQVHGQFRCLGSPIELKVRVVSTAVGNGGGNDALRVLHLSRETTGFCWILHDFSGFWRLLVLRDIPMWTWNNLNLNQVRFEKCFFPSFVVKKQLLASSDVFYCFRKPGWSTIFCAWALKKVWSTSDYLGSTFDFCWYHLVYFLDWFTILHPYIFAIFGRPDMVEVTASLSGTAADRCCCAGGFEVGSWKSGDGHLVDAMCSGSVFGTMTLDLYIEPIWINTVQRFHFLNVFWYS